jgi:hypothetical protein
MLVKAKKQRIVTTFVGTILCAGLVSGAIASQPQTQESAPANVTPPSSATPATPANTAPAAQTSPPSSEKMVCRAQTNLGSRLGKRRVCRTAAEWEVMRRDAQQAVDFRQRMNSAGRSKGDGG